MAPRRSAALTLLFASLVAFGVLLFVPGRYDAAATASIDPGSVNPVTSTEGGGSATAIGLMQGNLIELVQSQRVALDVVKRLNLTAVPAVQQQHRNSDLFGKQGIDDWMAASILKNVDPKFQIGTNVLTIKYKTGDPKQAALIANAFLAATIDGSIAMKAAAGDQTARWFRPQLDELRKDLRAQGRRSSNFRRVQTSWRRAPRAPIPDHSADVRQPGSGLQSRAPDGLAEQAHLVRRTWRATRPIRTCN